MKLFPSCLPCPSLHSFCPLLSFSDFIVLYCTVLLDLFLRCSAFSHFSCLSSPFYTTLLSCPITPVCVSCLSILLSNSHAITVLSCSSSYSQALLTFNPCPVSCCLSCLLLSVLSPDLSVTPYLFCQMNSIQTYKAIYSPDCDSQVFLNSIIISLIVLAERLVLLSCPGYPVLSILCCPAHLFFYFVLFAMTSHNTYCLFHLLRSILSNYSRPYGCPIILPGHSRCPGCPIMSDSS
jgi:hypothetical protein